MDTLALLTSDNYFIEHPEDILGEAYTTSGMRGPVTKYKGTIDEAVAKINAPINRVSKPNVNFAPTMSVIESDSAQPTPDESIEIVQRIERQREKISKRAIEKTKDDGRDVTDPEPPAEMYTFTETFEQTNRINPALPAVGSNRKISEQELMAYVWYMEQVGRRLSDKWYELAGYRGYDADNEVDIKAWLQQGVLFYFKGDFLPGYAYFAGNLYDRKTALEADREDIIAIYGEDTYNAQHEQFEKVFAEKVYNNRLKVNPEKPDNQLIILPNSEFARTFMIEKLDDGSEFYAPRFTDTKPNREKDKVGKANWKELGDRKSNEWDIKRNIIERFSIRDAFQFWLRYKNGYKQAKKQINWLEIINYYLEIIQYNEDREGDKASFSRKKAVAKQEGDRLFLIFLKTAVSQEDQLRLELQWNRDNNAICETDFDKVPVAFEYGKKFYGSAMDVRWEKKEAAAFMAVSGSGLIAYNVGMGKTLSAIMTMKLFMEAGWCKRPFLVVPGQTYKQWIAEIHALLPTMKINDFYNLSKDYHKSMMDENKEIMAVDEGSISIFTYEGFRLLGFNENTLYRVKGELAEILDQNAGGVGNDKDELKAAAKIDTLLGRAEKGIRVEIERLGFDFMCVDEAHSMKKIFTRVASRSGEKNEYEIQSGKPSSLGLKGFCISQYIQKMNEGRNVMLLTATPFTNSPLEVYSMLCMVGYEEMKNLGQNNLRDFFDKYCMSTYELGITAKMTPERKQVFKGWNNVQALQKLIGQFMNYKEADHMDEKGRIVYQDRPDKIVLPFEKVLMDGVIMDVAESERIRTSLNLTEYQKMMMDNIRAYVVDGHPLGESSYVEADDITEDEDEDSEGSGKKTKPDDGAVEVDINLLDGKEKLGVRVMQGVGWARSVALSPYLFQYSNLGTPTYLEYVEASPKLNYIMQCVASVKKYHEDHDEPVSGQIIYMDRGKDYFHLLKDYLVKVIGYKPHEIGIIMSKMDGGRGEKERIKNLFNGERYDEKAGAMIPVTDEERVKIVIGSRSIREGMNLQKKTSTLYNAYIDWNPTDNIQLDGRAHRQGNQFKKIRVVIPLMIDSMDIFMFQKLEEKTARINAIWNRDGKTSIIKIEDFDPAEQKYNLITDPEMLAKMEVEDIIENINDEIAGINNQQDVLSSIVELLGTTTYKRRDIVEFVEHFRPRFDKDGNKITTPRSDGSLISAVDDIIKNQTDADGNKIIGNPKYERNNYRYSGSSIVYVGEHISQYGGEIILPYNFKEFKISVNNLAKKIKEVLVPNKIDATEGAIKHAIEGLNAQVEDLTKQKSEINGKEAIAERISNIREEQARRKIGKTTPEMRVVEFEKLNYILSEVKAKSGQQIAFENMIDPAVCPPRDKDGKPRIDKEALVQLEQCIKGLPQTKVMHLKADETYTDKRVALHNEIIYGLYKGIACVHQDQPICVLTAGAPGSGKSYFLKKYAPYMLSNKIIKIDADAIRAMLPEYKGWNSDMTHKETKDIVNEALSYVSTPCKHDLLYDGTMNTPANYFPLIGKLKELGYRIYIVFVNVPKEYSRRRVLERYQRTGRYVPLEVIDEFFAHAPGHFDKIKTMVDGWMEVDGVNAKITGRSGEMIPQEREYFTQEVPEMEPEVVEQVAESAVTSAGIKEAIGSLQTASEFADDDSELMSAIESLETMLEFI